MMFTEPIAPPLTEKTCRFAENVWHGSALAGYIASEQPEKRLESE